MGPREVALVVVVEGGGGGYISQRAIFKQKLIILATILPIVNLTTPPPRATTCLLYNYQSVTESIPGTYISTLVASSNSNAGSYYTGNASSITN